MRWICWALALLAVCVVASSAVAVGPGCTSCDKYGTLGAPACAWQFCDFAPTCAQCVPSACDNAWATYPQEKARRMAFWHPVGTGGSCRSSHGCCRHPMPSNYQPVFSTPQPVPARQPVPAEIEAPVPAEASGIVPLPPVPQPLPPTRATTSRWKTPWRR